MHRVQNRIELYFRQLRVTPDPMNKYIFYDAGINPEGKK